MLGSESEVVMTPSIRATSNTSVEVAEKALRAAIHLWSHPSEGRATEAAAREFVTVSRQPGAGAVSFSHRLAERLNRGGVSDWAAGGRGLGGKGWAGSGAPAQ